MDLIIQFRCVVYSFLFGFIACGLYHILNRLLLCINFWLRMICQCMIGISFGYMYYKGLVFLNQGILRIYFFIMLFLGYCIYQKYYAYYFLYILEEIIRILKVILSPFNFFFYYINGIIQRKKRVKLKWRKRKKRKI